MNTKNFHELKVEVTHVFSLTWLQDHMEIERNKEIGTLNIIALDRKGRKFTNCTSVYAQYEIKADNILNVVYTSHQYSVIKDFVQQNKQLMFLKQSFDENPSAMVQSDIKNKVVYNQQQEEVLLHNNFGICNQQRIEAIGKGLGRVKAFYSSSMDTVSSSKLIESGYVEIAAYDKLQTSFPNYNTFFSDLYTVNKGEPQIESMFAKDYISGTFNLGFGSSLLWVVEGGTNFWKQIPEKYQVSHSSILLNQEEGNLDSNLLMLDKGEEETNIFRYQLSCQKPNDKYKLAKQHRFRVNLNQQNQQSRFLLQPAAHEITIQIQCEPPQSQKIYWAQESKDLTQIQLKRLPKFKLIHNEKVNYILVNSKHYIRSLFYNNQNYVFFNYSSVSNSLVSTNDNMLKLYTLEEDYPKQIERNLYDKRRLEALNITGSVYVQGLANGYFKSYRYETFEKLTLSYEVKDQLRIEIVRNVDIQPKYKSIYIKNDFKFRIIHGSGHFQVHLNNSNLAVATERDGQLTVSPLKEGPLQIMIEDVEIPDSEMAVAEILISDILKLELDSPGSLIEQSSSMELFVTAFDTYGVEFDQDQYETMKFDIEIERTEIQSQGMRGLVAVSLADNRKFEAQGNEPGNYQLTAYSFKYQPTQVAYKGSGEYHTRIRVTSEMLRIEVFPFLEFHPSSLLLTPLMRYTLQIVGGPSKIGQSQFLTGGSVQIKFDIEDQTIASVDMFREVTGKEVGETKLYYELVQLKPSKVTGVEKRSIISKKTVPIKVQLVTSIEIPQNDQREVYEGSMIKLNAILKYKDEIFSHGVAPISYNWNSSNPGILQIQVPNKEVGGSGQWLGNEIILANKKIRDNEQNRNDVMFYTQFNSSTIYLLSNKNGEAMISVLLAIEYPDKYRNNKNYFNTKIVLKVAEKLFIGVPEFMNNPELQTHLYLMPPNTQSKIETNKKTRLRLGKSQQSVYDYAAKQKVDIETQVPIIQLVQDEAIRTTDRYGKVTVIVEENQAFSGQVVMLNVLVTDIYNIAVKDAYQALNMPLGSSIKLQVKFQNDKAHLFAQNIEGINVGIELSHPRVVTATLDQFNSTLTLQALGSGDCNVVVFLISNPSHIFDVFRVRVTSIVKPHSPVSLHVGGQVQFKLMGESSTIQNSDGQTLWSSSSPSILDINQLTGEARGLSEGRAEVMLSNHINAASIVQVSKVKYAEIDERSRKNLQLVTDLDNGYSKEQRFRIKLYFADQLEEIMPTVQYDGLTLIKQNVVLTCESDYPQYIDSRAEISDLEGYFCSIKLKSLNLNERLQIPKVVKLSIYVQASSFSESQSSQQYLYKEKIMSFDVTLVSRIRVESYYRNGLKLNRDLRSADIKIFSNVDFTVLIDNLAQEDQGYDLIRHKVNKSESIPNEYYLKIAVPREITHTFQTNIILTHPLTGERTVLPVYFDSSEGDYRQEGYQGRDSEDDQQNRYFSEGKTRRGFFQRLYDLIAGDEEEEITQISRQETLSREQQEREKYESIEKERKLYRPSEKPSPTTYIVIFIIFIIVLFFFMVNVCQELFQDILEGRWPQQRNGYQQQRRNDGIRGNQQPRNIVRDPIQRNLFGNVSNNQSMRYSRDPSYPQNSPIVQNQPSVRQPLNMSQMKYSPLSRASQDSSNRYQSNLMQ